MSTPPATGASALIVHPEPTTFSSAQAQIARESLEFVGYGALQPIITHGPAHLSDADRAESLAAVRQAFRALSATALWPRLRTLPLSFAAIR